jgi:drug/metabolite transporter (DMT)-like permease
MGILDSLAGILMVYGGKGTSGTLQTLLFQAVIPLTMILAIIILKEKYTSLQYVGAFGVVLGVFVAFYPSLGTGGNLVYVLVYFSSVIPTAVSSVYKEHSLKKMFVNMFYLQAWVSLFQVLTSFVFLPINVIPVIGGMQVQDIPQNIIDGTKCFVGTPSREGDNCHWAFVPVLGYTVANFLFNLLSLYILKSLSSAIVYIQNTVRLPLVAIAFHIPRIVGTESIGWGSDDFFTFGGLVLIITGLALYMRDAIKKNKKRRLYSSLIPPESLSIKYNSAPLPVLSDSEETFDMDTNVNINLLNIN